MKATIRTIQHGDDESTYSALMFACPGCAEMHGNDGIHILPVNTTLVQPSWDWDGDLEFPTISPSILTGKGGPQRCHSFLAFGKEGERTDKRAGVLHLQDPFPNNTQLKLNFVRRRNPSM